MNEGALVTILAILLVVLLAAGAWLLKRMRDEQAELLGRVASLEADAARPASPAVPLLDQASRFGRQGSTLKVGELAPDVTFLDITGGTVSLADFRGQDTTIIFWDGTSEDCREIVPGLASIESRPERVLPGLLLVVPAASAGNQVLNLRSPLVIDVDGSAARAFGVDTWPAALMVDARGNISSELAQGPDRVVSLAGGNLPHSRGLVRWAGLDFEVSRDTLTPRAETESLAENTADLIRERGARVVAEIGTGSGVVATYLARESPADRIYAVEISMGALEVARRNMERHGVLDRVTLLEGSLLEPVPERPDLVVADLPYLNDRHMSNADYRLQFESPVALYGGPRGLELYDQLFGQLAERGWIVPLVIEVNPDETNEMQELLRSHFPSGTIDIRSTYRGGARVVVFLPDTPGDSAGVPPETGAAAGRISAPADGRALGRK